MSDAELRLALRRASRRGDWTAAERIGRRIGWRLLAAALGRAFAGLLSPRRGLRLR